MGHLPITVTTTQFFLILATNVSFSYDIRAVFSSFQNMSVRTYNPSVRVGNWNEDIQLEEDTLKDFLKRRESGDLLIQKSANLKNSVLKDAELSVSRDGRVHIGDKVIIVCPGAEDGSVKPGSLSTNGSNVTGSPNTKATARNTFTIKSCDGTMCGTALKYGQKFYLCASDEAYLHSDRATFQKCAKKSRHNEVSLVPEISHHTEWQVIPFDPQFRMELEFSDVPANKKVIINHVATNQNLCLEGDHKIRSSFGNEFEISTFTDLDSHKAEKFTNHWLMTMNVPGDPILPVTPPQ